jgi:hypothetical protein
MGAVWQGEFYDLTAVLGFDAGVGSDGGGEAVPC